MAILSVATMMACGDSSDPLQPDVPDPLAAPPHRASVVAISPTAGAELTGTVQLRARVEGHDPSTYSMNWRVDWGNPNPMSDAGDGTVVATVDVSTWDWKGTGPYSITLRATDSKGRKMGETTFDITVAPGVESGDTIVADTTATDTTTTDTTSTASGNPLEGAVFWSDPESNAARQAEEWKASRPQDAAYMDYMASGSQADWVGDWTSDPRAKVSGRATQILNDGGLPVFVLYNIPGRDCGSYSGGGATSAGAYRYWIDEVAAGLGARKGVFIVEPDALAQLGCLSSSMAEERLSLLRYAVHTLKERTGAAVYLDAGHPRWHSADVIAARLQSADVAAADGFSLNVSNFVGDADNVDYGLRVSDLVGGSHFVIDSSRNGQGPALDGEWCNPDGRGLGRMATADTGVDRLDAYLWIKRPGESDGECNGGPRAGAWWADYALGLAQRAWTGSTVASR